MRYFLVRGLPDGPARGAAEAFGDFFEVGVGEGGGEGVGAFRHGGTFGGCGLAAYVGGDAGGGGAADDGAVGARGARGRDVAVFGELGFVCRACGFVLFG